MPFDVIDTGTTANDGTGDPLRTAFTKTNTNFALAVEGATGSTPNNVPVFDGTTGKLVKDSGVSIATLTAGLNFAGLWNASTNTPTLTSSVGTEGTYYVVSVAGSTNLNGVSSWAVGESALFTGGVWVKVASSFVSNPGTSTNNRMVVFDGTTGKLVKQAAFVESDVARLSTAQDITGVKNFQSETQTRDINIRVGSSSTNYVGRPDRMFIQFERPTANGGIISFHTTPSTVSGLAERMRIAENGNVIVGNGDAGASPAAALLRGTNASGTNVAGPAMTIQAGRGTGTGAGGSLSLQTAAAGTTGSTLNAATTRLFINAAGQVGIGTTSPATGTVLDVNGVARAGKFEPSANTVAGNGMYLPASNTVAFSTNGSERWRITSTGNFQAPSAQTIQTATGALTLGSAAGDGNVVLSPHGTGAVVVNTTTASSGIRFQVNGNTLIDGTFQLEVKSVNNPRNYNVFTRLGKVNIAPAETAIIDIDAVFATSTNFSSAVAELTLIVGFTTSPTNLQGHFKYDFLTVTNGTGGGTATITMMHDGSAGSFSVGTANFAVTRPSARKIRITYTNANSAGNNDIFAFVRGYGIDTISIT
jgi:hypothetical protein